MIHYYHDYNEIENAVNNYDQFFDTNILGKLPLDNFIKQLIRENSKDEPLDDWTFISYFTGETVSMKYLPTDIKALICIYMFPDTKFLIDDWHHYDMRSIMFEKFENMTVVCTEYKPYITSGSVSLPTRIYSNGYYWDCTSADIYSIVYYEIEDNEYEKATGKYTVTNSTKHD